MARVLGTKPLLGNKNLNAKLICDFGVPRFIFYAVSAGLRES